MKKFIWVGLVAMLAGAGPQDRSLTKIKKDYMKAFGHGKAKTDKRIALVAELVSQVDKTKPREALAWIACCDLDEDVRLAAVAGLAPHAADKKTREALLDVVLKGHIPITREPRKKIWNRNSRGGGATPKLRRVVAAIFRSNPHKDVYNTLKKALTEKRRKPDKKTPDLQLQALNRALAAEMLGEIGGEEAIKILKASSRKASDPVVQTAVARALGYTYHSAALDALKKWPKAQDPVLKKEIETAIARIEKWDQAQPPDEAYREKDTERSFEVVFLVDQGFAMKSMIPSVVRIIKERIADLKAKAGDKPIRATVVTMQNLYPSPKLFLRLKMTSDLDAVVPAIEKIKIKRKSTVTSQLMFPSEVALRTAAYRVGWSRNSDKRIYVFTADRGLPHGKYSKALAEDLKDHEHAELYLYHTFNRNNLPALMGEIAKAGAGTAVHLIDSVPGELTVILRGASAIDAKLIKKIFKLKQEPKSVLKATSTYEIRFKNESSLDLDALQKIEIERNLHAGLTDIMIVYPAVSARGIYNLKVQITVNGENNPRLQQAIVNATEEIYKTVGVALLTGMFATRKTELDPNKPNKPLLFELTPIVHVRPELSLKEIEDKFRAAGFNVSRR